jgi:hypothetical protein
MSAQRKIRRELVQSFRQHPRPLIDTLAATYELPEFDPASLRPWKPAWRPPVEATRPCPPLAWRVDLIEPAGTGFVLLVDVVTRMDPHLAWDWLLWRTNVRAESACPTWLMVCPTDEPTLVAIRKAFDHEPANMPVLITPDARVLALPSRPAPKPAFTLHL